MKNIIIFIILSFWSPNIIFGQEYNFKKKVIRLNISDTSDCIKFITNRSIIFIKKSDYLYAERIDLDSHYQYYIEQTLKPQICLTDSQDGINNCCKGTFRPKTPFANASIKYEVLKFLMSSKCVIYMHNSKQIIKKITIKHKTYKGSFDEYLVVYQSKSNKEILSVLYGLGE